MRQIKAGSTDIIEYVDIIDSTDGTPETGVTAATGGLVLEYLRNGAAAVSLAPLSDLAAANSAHSDGGIKHVGRGRYRVDLPDAACAAGVDTVAIQGTATGMIVLPVTLQLVGYNPRTELTAARLAFLDAAISSRMVGAGTGAIAVPYALTSSVDASPIADAEVWVTTDLAGTNVIASGRTNAFGIATFYLDAGTYYFWRQKDGYNFTNPDTEIVA